MTFMMLTRFFHVARHGYVDRHMAVDWSHDAVHIAHHVTSLIFHGCSSGFFVVDRRVHV